MNFADESFLKYEEVKQKHMIDILAYLDIKEKKDRLDKVLDQVNKDKAWKGSFGQKPPKIT